MARIGGEQCVEDRRTGARRAHDRDRLDDPLVADPRIGAHVLDDLEPHVEQAPEESAHDPSAEDGELRLVLDRAEEQFERLEELVARTRARSAEGIDSLAAATATGEGFAEELLPVERHRCLERDRQDLADVHA